jgi:hypothetical protein
MVALWGCSPWEDGASGRNKLIGNYTLVVPADQPLGRKDFASSVLRLSKDGMFTQQCRYRSGRTDSVIGSWSYSNRRAQFSAFKDCAGIWPRSSGKRDMSASLIVELSSPTAILLSPDVNVRYERYGAP